MEQEKQKRKIGKISYSNFVEARRESFLAALDKINAAINLLIQEELISPDVQLRARIKSFESINNNSAMKDLFDIFGMEVVVANKDEEDKIRMMIERLFQVQRVVNHNKDNGYIATHFVITPGKKKNGDTTPFIEIQVKPQKTKKAEEIGKTADHLRYKKETPEQVIQKYKDGGFTPDNIPQMWIRRQDGRIMKLLNGDTLQLMYPFLRLNSIGTNPTNPDERGDD